MQIEVAQRCADREILNARPAEIDALESRIEMRIESGRRGAQAARRAEAGQNRVPTARSSQKPTVPLAPNGIEENVLERVFASTDI